MATSVSAADLPHLAGVELGGTKCVCILARGPDDILACETFPTRGRDETLGTINEVLAGWEFEALGIASFGPLDLVNGRVARTPKPGWNGADLNLLKGLRAVPVAIDTDVNGAALAEGLWGAARGLGSWAYVTVGTGVGVGSIVDGRPIRGLGHTEAGHTLVRRGEDRWPGSCPFHGDCVEGLVSGPAIAARTGIHGPDIPADHEVWGHVADALAGLCHNLLLTSLPERILIGGGVVGGHPGLIDTIAARLETSLAGYSAAALIDWVKGGFVTPPALGAMAGPLGAIALARSVLPIADAA